MAGSSDQQQLDGQEPSSEYKMVVLRADDLHEVRSFQLSLANIYVIVSIVLLTLTIAIFSALAFTPLKNLIPGYGRIEANEEFLKLVEGVDVINERIEAQDLYMIALRNLIVPSQDTTAKALDLPPLSSIVNNSPEAPTSVLTTTGAYSNVRPTEDQAVSAAVSSDLWTILERNPPQRPVEGIISSEFDPSIKHFGVDVLAPAKSPVRAIMDGYVITSGWDLETGYTVGVQHEGQILSFYKHNSHLLKEKGTFVKAGEAVAIIGNTGTLSSGPHLHFEFWHNGKPINPKDIINFN